MTTGQLAGVVRQLRQVVQRHEHALRTDGELLESYLACRDEAAFAEMVRRHGPMVLGVCRRVLRNDSDAEDAFQATFLVLVRKAATIRPREMVGNFLYGVAFNTARKARAMSGKRRTRERAAGAAGAGARGDISGQTWDRLQHLLDEEMSRLPDLYRVPLVLCDLEGTPIKEAARRLGCPQGTLASRLARARVLLAKNLSRHGLPLSGGGLAAVLSQGVALAAVPPPLANSIVHAATTCAAGVPAVSAQVAALTEGVLKTMLLAKLKTAGMWIVAFGLLCVAGVAFQGAALLQAGAAQKTDDRAAASFEEAPLPAQEAPKQDKAKPPRQCIILWMNGGPSQTDTFDPKAGNIALFKAIDTNVKGIQFSETLPLLAKQANHLAILRGVTTSEGDHGRGAYLMHTGVGFGGASYPSFACVLAKELGDVRPDLPRFVSINSTVGPGPGILGRKFGPLAASTRGLPAIEAFQALELDMDKAAAMRMAIAGAFTLSEEKKAVRDAYGRGRFGNGCLLARRLIEAGVPVVEVELGGWDAHANAAATTKKLCGELDAGMASLLNDLHDRKLLEHTLIVWMGEFGRSPRINRQNGRDHWPWGSVVLAGAGIKGGQAIGKTSADGMKLEEGEVTPRELLATIYRALGVDAAKKNRAPGGDEIPLVEKGTSAVKQALR